MTATKKRLTKDQKAMVDRYKLVTQLEESYSGSVFYVPSSSRSKGYETELLSLGARFKALTGVSIDEYTWKVKG
jgi:hypothetical protein